jgi:hypothetical protein
VKKHLVLLGLLGCVSAIVAYTIVHLSKEDPAQRVFSVSDEELARLKSKASRGECRPAAEVGQLYLNEALDRETAMTWFRIAARCPDAGSKELLAEILAQLRSDPAAIKEINQLVDEIRSLDPERAAVLVQQFKSEGAGHVIEERHNQAKKVAKGTQQ